MPRSSSRMSTKIMRMGGGQVILLLSSVILQSRSSFAFDCTPSRSIEPRRISSKRFVYTPEQQEDDENGKGAVGDEVLESLVAKLDKSARVTKPKDNKAMAFLKKIGKVGGAANKDFANAVGSDEGSGMAAASSIRKSNQAYLDSTESGVIDDLSEVFPLTSSGTEWRGVSDRLQGGTSEGIIKREVVDEKTANVLVGSGLIQMVTELSKDFSKGTVDASEYDGIELDVLSKESLNFNVHLRTQDPEQEASYRHTVDLECLFAWQTIRIPFSSFLDENRERVDCSRLKRIGIVARDKGTDVYLAISGLRLYTVI